MNSIIGCEPHRDDTSLFQLTDPRPEPDHDGLESLDDFGLVSKADKADADDIKGAQTPPSKRNRGPRRR